MGVPVPVTIDWSGPTAIRDVVPAWASAQLVDSDEVDLTLPTAGGATSGIRIRLGSLEEASALLRTWRMAVDDLHVTQRRVEAEAREKAAAGTYQGCPDYVAHPLHQWTDGGDVRHTCPGLHIPRWRQ